MKPKPAIDEEFQPDPTHMDSYFDIDDEIPVDPYRKRPWARPPNGLYAQWCKDFDINAEIEKAKPKLNPSSSPSPRMDPPTTKVRKIMMSPRKLKMNGRLLLNPPLTMN
jgi:hypothetical protein